MVCEWCDAKCPPIGYVELLSPECCTAAACAAIEYAEPPAAAPPPAPAPGRNALPRTLPEDGHVAGDAGVSTNKGCPDATLVVLFARLGRTRPDSRALVRGDADSRAGR